MSYPGSAPHAGSPRSPRLGGDYVPSDAVEVRPPLVVAFEAADEASRVSKAKALFLPSVAALR